MIVDSTARLGLVNLPRKYRPQSLDEVVGQSSAIGLLRAFLATAASQGEPVAFLFHGPTGTGKTSAALALAAELGCDLEQPEMSGVHEIPSGQQDGAAVRGLLDHLRLRPLFGSGWRVAIVNEADNMTVQAEAVWLDGLERLPARTVVIFTTNAPERISQRLGTRCVPVHFTGEPSALRRAVACLARRVWRQETGSRLATVPRGLGCIEGERPTVSIRLALQQLAALIATGGELATVQHRDDTPAASGSAAARKAWATRRRKGVCNG